jgi:hypothetical protein
MFTSPGLDDNLQLSKGWTIEWLTSHMWKIALLTSTCRPGHGRQSLIIQEMDDGVLFFKISKFVYYYQKLNKNK